VPVAGKTGTTNDAKDVWFIGFTSNIVAGCYLGYDQPRTLGEQRLWRHALRSGLQRVHAEAVKEFGGTEFAVPPRAGISSTSTASAAPSWADAKGPNVIAEYFRDGQDTLSGWVWSMAALAAPIRAPAACSPRRAMRGQAVTTSTGKKKVIPKKADFGTLSSGGLY
jgi:penicillin-binding protein 1A